MANGMDDSSDVTSAAWSSNWNNESPSEKPRHQRSATYPLRRPHQTGCRPGETIAVVVGEGFDVLNQNQENHSYHVSGNGTGSLHRVKSIGDSNRRTSVGERARIWKSSANFYRILISVVAVFFLIETVTHGFVFLLFRHTDLQAESLEIFPRVFETEQATSGDDARFTPRNVVERLLLSKGRATVAELRKEARFPVRLPRLALVCIKSFSSASRSSRGSDLVQERFVR